jgi:uncharacterized FlgJ-related protein
VPIDFQFQFPNSSVSVELLPEKAAFIPESATLLIADPHFGKATHFRKAGIPIPEQIFLKDLVPMLEGKNVEIIEENLEKAILYSKEFKEAQVKHMPNGFLSDENEQDSLALRARKSNAHESYQPLFEVDSIPKRRGIEILD